VSDQCNFKFFILVCLSNVAEKFWIFVQDFWAVANQIL
jgi:hypothetical protein